jgi:hypothetical protein
MPAVHAAVHETTFEGILPLRGIPTSTHCAYTLYTHMCYNR